MIRLFKKIAGVSIDNALIPVGFCDRSDSGEIDSYGFQIGNSRNESDGLFSQISGMVNNGQSTGEVESTDGIYTFSVSR